MAIPGVPLLRLAVPLLGITLPLRAGGTPVLTICGPLGARILAVNVPVTSVSPVAILASPVGTLRHGFFPRECCVLWIPTSITVLGQGQVCPRDVTLCCDPAGAVRKKPVTTLGHKPILCPVVHPILVHAQGPEVCRLAIDPVRRGGAVALARQHGVEVPCSRWVHMHPHPVARDVGPAARVVHHGWHVHAGHVLALEALSAPGPIVTEGGGKPHLDAVGPTSERGYHNVVRETMQVQERRWRVWHKATSILIISLERITVEALHQRPQRRRPNLDETIVRTSRSMWIMPLVVPKSNRGALHSVGKRFR
mmetsp:Transcript_47946/g.104297  ORF Transcript_47946/g.104297 Transcript_47946/m.104297 type:complete len:309 (+) Transcript_47946:752-1678(+)